MCVLGILVLAAATAQAQPTLGKAPPPLATAKPVGEAPKVATSGAKLTPSTGAGDPDFQPGWTWTGGVVQQDGPKASIVDGERRTAPGPKYVTPLLLTAPPKVGVTLQVVIDGIRPFRTLGIRGLSFNVRTPANANGNDPVWKTYLPGIVDFANIQLTLAPDEAVARQLQDWATESATGGTHLPRAKTLSVVLGTPSGTTQEFSVACELQRLNRNDPGPLVVELIPNDVQLPRMRGTLSQAWLAWVRAVHAHGRAAVDVRTASDATPTRYVNALLTSYSATVTSENGAFRLTETIGVLPERTGN
jgi:hypothetical protein